MRETFREFELRAARAARGGLGEDDAAPAERVGELIRVTAREVPVAELGALDGELVAWRRRPGEGPPARGRCRAGRSRRRARGGGRARGGREATAGRRGRPCRGARSGHVRPRRRRARAAHCGGLGGEEVLVAEAETLAAFTLARGEQPCRPTTGRPSPRRTSPRAPRLEHDTMVAAYLIDPARRGYPLDELATESGVGAEVEGANGVAERAVLTRVLAERQRARLEEDGLTQLFHEIELPLVDVLVELGRPASKLDVDASRRSAAASGAAEELERRVWGLAGEEFTIGSPQQLAPILFEKLGLSTQAARQAGYSTDAPASSRRSATSTRSSPRSRSGARSRSSSRPTSTPSRPDRPGWPPPPPSTRRPRPPGGSATRTCRTSRSAPNRAARSVPASSPRRAAGHLRRLLAGRAAAARAHRRRSPS